MHRVTRGVFDSGSGDNQTGWIIFVGDRFAASRSLLQAVESEFQDFEIVLVPDVAMLLEKDAAYWRIARLMIVDCKFCSPMRENQTQLKQLFSQTIIAVAYDDRKRQDQEILASMECELVRGFLPMNLQLDTWLSAIRLIINGGDYMPMEIHELFNRRSSPSGMVSHEFDLGRRREFRENPTDRAEAVPAARLSVLTERELDVLRLASQGHQNKIIAAHLGISEHTIKLHMHHVISKLGAHNRTEAAAAYIQGTNGNHD